MSYYTAKVHIYQGNYRRAIETINEGIKYADRIWKIRILNQLHLCQQELGDRDGCAETLILLESLCEDLQNTNDLRDYITTRELFTESCLIRIYPSLGCTKGPLLSLVILTVF